jgi:hypothetical protein
MQNNEFQNPIDPEKITETPHNLPYAHHAGSALVTPDNLGKIKGQAMLAMEHQTDMQLNQIYEQMHFLAEQAKKLQDRKTISEIIYQAEMRFDPLINHIYYLYYSEKKGFIMSMVAPGQWGRSGLELQFRATIRLLADHTWDVLEKSVDWES